MTCLFNDQIEAMIRLVKECIKYNPVGGIDGFDMEKFELKLRKEFAI